MGAAENKQLLQHIFAELAAGNSKPFVDSFADDIRWTLIGSTKWSSNVSVESRASSRSGAGRRPAVGSRPCAKDVLIAGGSFRLAASASDLAPSLPLARSRAETL